jgi:hypothetical protein
LFVISLDQTTFLSNETDSAVLKLEVAFDYLVPSSIMKYSTHALIIGFLLSYQTIAQDLFNKKISVSAAKIHTIERETIQVQKDQSGELVEVGRYNKRKTTYDEQGKVISEYPEIPRCGYSDPLKRKIKYDSSGRMIEYNAYLNGRLWSQLLHRYDTQGNLLEVVMYDYRGALEFKWVNSYDASGNLIEAIKYTHNGTRRGRLEHKEIYAYNEHGDETDYKNYASDGKLDYWSRNEYEYDEKGNWVKRVFYRKVVDGKERPADPSEITHRITTYY